MIVRASPSASLYPEAPLFVPPMRLPARMAYLRYGLGTLLEAMGPQRAARSARWLARSICELHPPLREQMDANLRQAYGSTLSEKQRSRLIVRVFENVAAFWTEVLFSPRLWHPDHIRRRVVLCDQTSQWNGPREDHPTVFITTAFGHPALGACALSLTAVRPLHVVVDVFSYAFAQHMQRTKRRFVRLRLLPANEAARCLPAALEAKENALILTGAASPHAGGCEADFLGRRARRHASAVRLALRHRADIVVFGCRRKTPVPGNGAHALHFELEIIDVWRDGDRPRTARALLQHVYDGLTRLIDQDPEQYLWTRA
jgi:lauroyl/myristoyl acyltransferase